MQIRLLFFAALVAGSFSCRKPDVSRAGGQPGSADRASSFSMGSLPDPALTPGDTLEVTKDDVCTPGYSKKIRSVPAAVKRRVYAAYGRSIEKGICCEVDHLVSLELGGSNRLTNLWPEPYDILWNAHVKDKLEGRMHKLVCSGELNLATAQKAIAKDWIATYKEYYALPLGTRSKRFR